MKNDTHDRLSELFERAVELPPDARSAFIDGCTDPAIRAELKSLLAAHDRTPNLLERLAGEVMPAALQAVVEDDSVTGQSSRRAQPPASTQPPRGAAKALEPGSRFGTYEIQERIAAGGIGIVYHGFDPSLQRPVAIKTLAWSAPDGRESLLREARAASALNHPHICTIYEVGEYDGVPFIAMEYVEGRPLRDVIPSEGLPTELLVRYGSQIAEAIEYAHRHGVIHRDLKSANVMISDESQAKVLDFGLASRVPATDVETLTRTRVAEGDVGPLAGTLAYLAPEVLRGGPPNRRSDVWALGVVLYEMASGKLPFQGSTLFDLTAAILEQSPAPLPAKLPMPLRAVIGRCLARDPAQRYQHGGEVRVALETLQLGRDSAVWRDEVPADSVAVRRWRRRDIVIAAAVMLAAAALVVRSRTTRALTLTERDTLLVADFVNTTGDSVFDGALKQALSIHLEQSPFLSIVSREEARDTLRLMTKSPDDRLVGDLAREACQRLGAKAMIEGSIAPIGSHYAIGLHALNCESGKTIVDEQTEAAGRDQVLKALGAATSILRRKLGESLPTIQRFNAPLEQATTSSLEALKAFSVGEDIRAQSAELGAVPFYKRAIELDSSFATAYARLSTIYGGVGQDAEMRRNMDEAYARRDRVSERERFYIDGRHCVLSSEPDCYHDVHELWKRTYPRDPIPYANLAANYNFQGMWEQAVENGIEAMRLGPNHKIPYGNLAVSYLCLGRPTEAKRTVEQAFARHLDSPQLHFIMYRLAFFNRDDRAMATERKSVVGSPEEAILAELESDAAAFDGHMGRSHELRVRAEQLAAAHLNERRLSIRANGALYDAAQGDIPRARNIIHAMSAQSLPTSVIPLLIASSVLSRDYRQADLLFRQFERADPGPPGLFRSIVRVLRDMDTGDRSAIDRLRPATTRELAEAQYFRPVYMRGLIYLHARDGAKAASEFQRILDHRGVAPTSPLYPLAYVQQARAYVLSGDQTKARKAYQDFLALWKDADPDIPILREARAEFTNLREPHDAGRQLR